MTTPDMFTPLDELNRMAPHNVLAAIFSGRGVGGTQGGVGLGQGQAPPPGQGGSSEGQQQSQGQSTGQGQRQGQGQTTGLLGQGISLGTVQTGQQQGQGQGTTTISTGTTSSGGTSSGEKQFITVAGPMPGGPRTGTGVGGAREFVLPSTATIKVIDKETKLPLGGAAVYSDDYPVGVTDMRGKLVTSELPAGKHTLSVDAVGYDLGEKEIVTPVAGSMPQRFNYDFELSYIEMPEEATAAAEEATSAATAAAEAAAATTGYEGGGYFGGSYGGGAPSYGAPSYGAPTYNAPSYPTQPTQPAAPSTSGLPLPPIDWLQQFLLLPFSTLQKAFSVGPMTQGGRCK